MPRVLIFLLSVIHFCKAELPCHGVSISECGYDGMMMELAFKCENDCKVLCDKMEGCIFYKWRPTSPLKSCKLYNIEFSDHMNSCNIIAGPGPWLNGTCDLENLDNSQCGVFRNGECTININTDNSRTPSMNGLKEVISKNVPHAVVCTNVCNGDSQCRHWQYTKDKMYCHRWIPRGYHAVEDSVWEDCKAHYAPQQKDKCECDEKLACFVDPTEALVIAGGTNSILDDIYISNRVELFKPDSDTGNSTSCLLPDLPYNRTEPKVNIVNKKLMVCGGDGGEHSCLQLENKEWVEMKLNTPRVGHQSWVVDNNLFLSGGIYSNETDIFGFHKQYKDSFFGERACAIQLKGEEVIVTGGRDGENWNSVSKQKDGFMEAWPPLMVGRSQHACGVAELEDNTTLLVVAGGYNSNYEALDSVEVLKIETWVGKWVTIEGTLPKPLNGFTMENVNNKLYIVGGKDDQNMANTEIFVFDPSTEKLSTEEEHPWHSRWNHGMTTVLVSDFEQYCVN